MRPFRPVRSDRRDVQYRHQASIGSEEGRAGTAEVYVPRSIMLAPMDCDRPLLADAGADAVRALDCLRPHAAEPGSPIAKTACVAVVAAVFDRDAGIVAEQKCVARLANHLVEAIEFLLGAVDQFVERLAAVIDFAGRQDLRRFG